MYLFGVIRMILLWSFGLISVEGRCRQQLFIRITGIVPIFIINSNCSRFYQLRGNKFRFRISENLRWLCMSAHLYDNLKIIPKV